MHDQQLSDRGHGGAAHAAAASAERSCDLSGDGYHFKELLAYRDRMTAEWGLNLINALPLTTLAEHEAQFGLLYIVQPTRVLRDPQGRAADALHGPFHWWFTGLRREQSPTRGAARRWKTISRPTGKQMKKVSLLADWDDGEVDAYAESMRSRGWSCTRGIHQHRMRAMHGGPGRPAQSRAPDAGAARSWSAASTRSREGIKRAFSRGRSEGGRSRGW